VCILHDLADDKPIRVMLGGLAVCVVRTHRGVFAVHDECTHEAVPLSEGDVDDGAIECWRHGSRFDLATGAVLSLPAVEAVQVYPVQITDDQVLVDVPPPG
jgi:3-phenylpropionate/trans-cinnamate dioxygenase ferredoxin subunit